MPSIQIPSVDLAPYHDPLSTPADRQAAATSLAAACHTLGFVAITNHGISPPLLQDAFITSKRLFSLPYDDKMKAPHPAAAMPHRGYSAPGLEKVYSKDEITASNDSATIRKITDYKESYEIGSDADPDQQNIWLPDNVLPGFRAFTTKFYDACNEVGNVILGAMADGLGLDVGSEQREMVLKLNGQVCNQLRLLHYPEVEAGKLQGEVLARMPAHTDWGGCTMLFQDGVGGLELQDPGSKEWVRAVPEEGSCVVNVGDFLERVTNGYFKSATHRVTLPPSKIDGTLPERYSIPYFIGPKSDTVGKPLAKFVTDAVPAKYDALTFAEYAAWRAKYSY